MCYDVGIVLCEIQCVYIAGRRLKMKKINWKFVNIVLWIEVVLCYVLPFKTIDNFQYQVGFPIPFISVYNTELATNPLMSMSLDPLGLLANGVIFYLLISACIKTYKKIRGNKGKQV